MNEINFNFERNTARIDESSGFQERLRKVVELFGSNSALARSIGSSETAIRKWVNGASEPKQSAIVAIAQAAEISIEWLMAGRGEMKQSQHNAAKNSAYRADKKGTPLERYLESGFDVWMCDNSNMEPTIHEGEICLVEPINDRTPKDGVYLVKIDGIEKIQRLQRLPGAIVLTNDNPAYRAADIRIEPGSSFPWELIGRIHRGGKSI